MSAEEKPRKNNVTHTRAIQRERSQQPLREPPDERIAQLMNELVAPIVYHQIASYPASKIDLPLVIPFNFLPVICYCTLAAIQQQV